MPKRKQISTHDKFYQYSVKKFKASTILPSFFNTSTQTFSGPENEWIENRLENEDYTKQNVTDVLGINKNLWKGRWNGKRCIDRLSKRCLK